VACISDDSTTANEVMADIKSSKMPLEIVAYAQPATFEAWKETIRKYEHDPSVQAFRSRSIKPSKSDEKDMRVAPSQVMRWTVDNVTKPIGGLWPFATQDGYVILNLRGANRLGIPIPYAIIQAADRIPERPLKGPNRFGPT
jgi:hypothetical protein